MPIRPGLFVILLGAGIVGLGAEGQRATPATAAGLTLVGAPVQLTPRLQELTFTSTALEGQTKVRVLLPEGYDENATNRYPVLHLYHGGNNDHTAWTAPNNGNAEARTAGLRLIVVMPDGGRNGYYNNWFNDGAFGTPAWATYHVDQLIPWIDAHYRTIVDRSSRAMAGLSMGGGGLRYAARRPDLIGITAAFSGAIDVTQPGLGIHAPAQLALSKRIFGEYRTEEVRWRGVNGPDLAANLSNTDVSLYTGDTSGIEVTINQGTRAVHGRFDEVGIRHRFTVYPGMGHNWATFGKRSSSGCRT